MRTLVLYDSHFGNTAALARAIEQALAPEGEVTLRPVSTATLADFAGLDLLVLGAPVRRHRPSDTMRALFDSLPVGGLTGVRAASFETGVGPPRTGTAMHTMGNQLRHLGATMLAPAGYFCVDGRAGTLVDGELDRAAAWARALAGHLLGQPA